MKCPNCSFDNPFDSQICGLCSTPLSGTQKGASSSESFFRPLKVLKAGIQIGKYQIIEKLGQGGMGIVYKARDTKLNRLVALKFFPLDITSDHEDKQRFVQEAQTASILDHPNICTIYEIDESEEGRLYIVMSCYEGETLKDKMKRGPMAVEDTVDFTIQITRGLDKAHQEGIVHRDIKPSNIMITGDGTVKILDFGLAKLQNQTKITRTATVLGTAVYMSPEQSQGDDVDNRTDIWAVGIVLYRLLTGQLPFRGTTIVSVINSILNKSPVPPMEIRKDIPEELERIIYKCLRKNRDDRYSSILKLQSDLLSLKNVLSQEGQPELRIEKRKPMRKEAERRHATVVFIEITGIDEMMEAVDAEEATSIMSRCLDQIDRVFEKYGGFIRKITGSTLMGFFGIPTAVENTSRRAVNAAIEIRNDFLRLHGQMKLKVPLEIRTGINTGMVLAGTVSPHEKDGYSIMGETVDIASRLKDFSTKGKIYVGPLTYRYTSDEFEYGPLKNLSLEAGKGSVRVHELLSVKERLYRTKYRKERMIFSEIVGRSQDMSKLEFHVFKVVNGEGSIVNVIGEAGIGKSRLVSELSKREVVKQTNLLLGRSLSIGRNLSFYPIIDILRRWAEIKEDDSPGAVSRKVENAVRAVYPEGVSEIFPFIATLMGIKLSGSSAERVAGIEGEALEKLILKSLRELIIQAAKVKPVVFVLEDIHWADSTSLEFFESLFRLVENNRILFINVFRPNYEETSDRLLRKIRERYERNSVEIHLEPLNENQCEVLIENLLKVKDIPDSIRDIITKRAEGNPFFIEEIVRSLIDEKIIDRSRGRFKLTKKIDDTAIPETINEVLMARIDKLDEGTRSLLKVASVIGRSFFYKILTDVAGNIEEIDDKIEFLKEGQLVLERQRMREVEYLFKHALVQEVTYESILLKKRKELHLQIANSIESIFSDRLSEFYGFLALHYSQGENLAKAEEYLIKAGEEAMRAAASSEALNYYQQALHLYLEKHGEEKDPETITHIEKNIAVALYNKGDMDQAVGYFDRVLKAWGEHFPETKTASRFFLIFNLICIAIHLFLPQKRKKAVPPPNMNKMVDIAFKRATALSSVNNYRMFADSIGVLKMLNRLDLNRIPNGATMYYHSSALFSFSGVSFKIAKKLLDYPGLFLMDIEKTDEKGYRFAQLMHGILSGAWGNELAYNERVIESALKFGQIWSASTYLLWSALLQTEQGNFSIANVCSDRLSQIGEVYDNEFAQARSHLASIRLNIKKRHLAEALSEIEKGKDIIHRTGHMNALLMYAFISYIQILQKDMQGAEETLIKARRFVSAEKKISPYHLGNYLLSRFLYDLKRLEEGARTAGRPELRRLRKKTLRSGKAAIRNSKKFAVNRTESCKLMGLYFWLTGKQRQALSWWEQGLQAGEKLGAKPELARLQGEIGRRMSDKNRKVSELNGKTAADFLAAARSLFEDMGLEQDLDAIDGFVQDSVVSNEAIPL